MILDVNRVAAGHEFCQVASRPISPGGRLLAYAVDTVGRRQYAIRVRDLATGEELPDVIADVTSNIAWAADGEAFFYARHDPTTLRPYRILRHRLGDDPSDDRLVHEETDDTFSCGVWLSRSKRYVLIGSFQTLTTEFRYLDAADPDASPKVLLPRERGHEYDIDHYRGRFYIRSNDGARNFRLLEADDEAPARDAWRELIPHRDDVLITGFELFRDHLVVAERHAGLTRLRVRRWDGPEHHIAFDEAACAVSIGTNREPETTTLRFHYSSLTTPPSVYDYDMDTRARTLLKREEVLGDFDPGRYETERLLATAPDGVRVPISLVRRKRETSGRGAAADAGPAPLLLYGYGAYGISMEPTFRSARLSLLDRGFTYAIAHVRGGEELGRRWYDDGKLRKKKNTFTDFIACAEHLVAAGRTAPGTPLRHGRQRRRVADGRSREHAPRPVPRRGRAGAVRRRRDHDARRIHPADHRRVRRVGESEPGGGLRVHPVILAVRQHGAGDLAAPARDDRPARLAGAVLGAGEVGGPAPHAAAGRRPAAVAEDQHGCRARRRVRALPAVSGDGPPVRLPAGLAGLGAWRAGPTAIPRHPEGAAP